MIVSVTRLRLRRWAFLPRFALHALRSQRQVRASAGFLAGCIASQPGLAFWTVTVWADEAAMRAFRNGGDHARSMRHLMHWCDEASYVHFPQPSAAVPTAEMIFDQMRGSGRLSKVLRPSPAHAAGEVAGISVPRITAEITPKVGRTATAA